MPQNISHASREEDTARCRNDSQHSDEELLALAHRYHTDCVGTMARAIYHAHRAGMILRTLKFRVRNRGDKWTVWLQDHFRGSHQTACDYMRVAKHWKELKSVMWERKELSLRQAVLILRETREEKQQNPEQRNLPTEEDEPTKADAARCELLQSIRNTLKRWPDEVVLFLALFVYFEDLLEGIRAEVALLAPVFVKVDARKDAKEEEIEAHCRGDESRGRLMSRELERACCREIYRAFYKRPGLTAIQRKAVFAYLRNTGEYKVKEKFLRRFAPAGSMPEPTTE